MAPRLIPVPDTPFRALGLIRVSHERAGMISPELQRTAIEDSVTSRGGVVVGWVEGVDESGSQARSRWWKKLDKCIAAIEAGEADELTVYKFSRVARHELKWAVAIDRVETVGGRIYSATEPFDTSTASGQFGRGMLAQVNVFEARVRSEGWKEVHARRRRNGLPHAGWPRIGYTYSHEDGYVVDPDTAPIAAECFRRYLNGDGFENIADYLAGMGIVSPLTGRRWTGRGVRSWMDSGHHAGFLHIGDTYQPAAHEAVITADKWARYQRERRRRTTTPPRLAAPTTVAAGLLRCSGCGYRMTAHADTRYGLAYTYRCVSRGCSAPAVVTRSRVERTLLAWLGNLADDVDAHAVAKAASRANEAVARAARTRIGRELVKVEDAMNRLTVDLASGRIRAAQYDAAREHFDDLRGQLQRQLDQVEASIGPVVPRAQIRGLLADWDGMSVDGRARVLRALVSRVEVARQVQARPTVTVFGAWE